MACTITPYVNPCDSRNRGGIKSVYFARYQDVTLTYDADGNIDTITFATGTSWHKVDIREQNANFVEARTGDFTARTGLYTGTLTFDIVKRSAALRTYLMGLENCVCGFLVGWTEGTGVNWIMGDKEESRAFFADGTQAATGAAFSDANVETVVIQAQQLEKTVANLDPSGFVITPAP